MRSSKNKWKMIQYYNDDMSSRVLANKVEVLLWLNLKKEE